MHADVQASNKKENSVRSEYLESSYYYRTV